MNVKVRTLVAKSTRSVDRQQLHHSTIELQNRANSRSPQTVSLSVGRLKEEGIRILRHQFGHNTVVVWIWCRSQAALEKVKELYKLNQLADLVFHLGNARPRDSEVIQSRVIHIDRDYFTRTVVVDSCLISANFVERIDTGRDEHVFGVTKLQNDLYALCRSFSDGQNLIRVFEDFRLQRNINIEDIDSPMDIVGSSEKGNCLYVSDFGKECVWRITREEDDQHKIEQWLTIDCAPFSLSVSNKGQLLVVSQHSNEHFLKIYGCGGKLIKSIRLPKDIEEPYYAVESGIGNFIILHRRIRRKEGKSGSGGTEWEKKWVVSELARDGQVVIRRFAPSNEAEELNDPHCLSIDSDDRVFVTDYKKDRVIVLDSDLKWQQILYSTPEDKKETRFQQPWRLYYDVEQKQIIVVGDRVNVYTLHQH